METKRFRIMCDRTVAEELVSELRKDDGSSISVSTPEKRLAGAVEVLSIVASLTSIGASLLAAWLAARPHLRERVEVQALDIQEDTPETEGK